MLVHKVRPADVLKSNIPRTGCDALACRMKRIPRVVAEDGNMLSMSDLFKTTCRLMTEYNTDGKIDGTVVWRMYWQNTDMKS